MDRRAVLKGGFALAVAAHTAVGVSVAVDPLLSAIKRYQRGLDEFNATASRDNDEQWDEIADATYGKHLEVLTAWDQPATTLEGAMEALRIALTDDGGVYGCEAANKMVQAAYGYMKTLTI